MSGIANGRRGSLLLALVLAGLATAALFAYMRGVERQALGRGESVEVLVAKDLIPAGTTADAASRKGLMGREILPSKAVIAGTISSLEDIAGKVASVDIMKGEQILKVRFVTPERARSAFAIPADRQAMTVEVSAATGVAGFVQPGNHVSVLAKALSGNDARVAYLVQDVEVLAVGSRATSGSSSAVASPAPSQGGKVVLTLSLSPSDVEKVAYAVMQGEVYFTLLPAGQRPLGSTPGRVAGNLFS